jgi:hypothetical protein
MNAPYIGKFWWNCNNGIRGFVPESSYSQSIHLDTNVYFERADPDLATSAGLVNMGYVGYEAYNWIISNLAAKLYDYCQKPRMRRQVV